MKKIIRLVFIVAALLLQRDLSANTVIVKGYIKDSANHAVANKTVKIYSNDSTNSGCLLSHVTVTNPNGYYIDTLSCNGDIRKLVILIENCNGTKITHEVVVNSSNTIEVNFITCTSLSTTPAGCKAGFEYTSAAAGIKFNSAGSAAAAGDSIISRSWSFGDGSAALTGNRADPTHAYTKTGSYTVCLVIKTKKGCESKYCSTVIYKVPGECFVDVHANIEPISKKKFRFTSNTVKVAEGDTIIKRIWKFGDNTFLEGNEVYPIKEYKDTGVYKVCVIVKTARGCENQHCFTVVIRDTVPSQPKPCKAYFTYTVKNSIILFNSAGSSAAEGDSIISRTWFYIDSTNSANPLTLSGNVIDTFFRYAHPGQYPVYLVIKTKKGCESKYSATVIIRPTVTVCQVNAKAIAEKITTRRFWFSSSPSTAQPGDTITQRIWKFGDGSVLEGNEVNPVKEYRDTGSYTVCVKIKTARGCEKEYCFTLVVRDSLARTCKAMFTSSIEAATVKFNSASSAGTSATDSIISRTWVFGDTSAPLKGNTPDPVHVYPKPGTYQVYLYIKTKNGCENKYASTVLIKTGPVACSPEVKFSAERIGLKKVQFNSSLSKAQEGDSIIQRRWKFGDGTALEGNVVNPVKEFPQQSVYNTCLQVKTAKGCEVQYCQQVNVQDSLGLPQTDIQFIRIVSINPNPVITRMLVTIWSRNNNTEVEIAIYDIYGTPKLTLKKVLAQGNNAIEINTAALHHGPYFLRVSAAGVRGGRDAKAFYKL